jgi:polyhydroxybutyrate depolymerase
MFAAMKTKAAGMIGMVALCAAALACGDDASSSGTGGGDTGTSSGGSSTGGAGTGGATGGGGTGGEGGTTFGGDRPVDVLVPPSYDAATPAPLLLLLHGYTASGAIQESYFTLQDAAFERGMIYAYPDGTIDGMDSGFWNASDACCDFFSTGIDDSGYLRGLIEEIEAAYNIDPKQIYLAGHSNGGFMSYRMACDHADKIAAIVSLAGANPLMGCTPSEPVSVLQVHGTADDTIFFDGGDILGNAYPSATESVAFWANIGGCAANPTTDPATLDLDTGLTGAETTVARHDGCTGGWAEQWTIQDGAHVPDLDSSWAPTILDFLMARPKP